MEFYSAVIKKIDSSGNLIWSKTYDNPTESDGYPGDDVIKSVRQTSDGGYIATGYFENENSWSLVSWVIKTDELGDIVWSKTYKKNNSTDTWAEDVIETDDGGFILTGNQKNDGNKAHAMLRKYSADGEVVWHKTYTRSAYNEGLSLIETSNNSIVFVGFSDVFVGMLVRSGLILLVLLTCWIIHQIVQGPLMRSFERFSRFTNQQWDNVLVEKHFFRRLFYFIPLIILFMDSQDLILV